MSGSKSPIRLLFAAMTSNHAGANPCEVLLVFEIMIGGYEYLETASDRRGQEPCQPCSRTVRTSCPPIALARSTRERFIEKDAHRLLDTHRAISSAAMA